MIRANLREMEPVIADFYRGVTEFEPTSKQATKIHPGSASENVGDRDLVAEGK